jgi:hypothetical protein
MKSSFSAFVCSLGLAAASTSGPRLVKDHILAVATDTSSFIEYINSLHLGQDGSENTQTADTLMNVFVNCIEQVVELEKCYGDQALLMECVDCAWAGVLSETSIICDGIEAALEADTTRCDSCLSKCDEEQASLVTCAVRLYCPESSEEEEHSKPPESFVHPIVAAGGSCKECLERARKAGGSEGDCFSLESTVIVEGKGMTSIKDLVIGDMVLSDEKGTYTKYYSKGHYNEKKSTVFMRIHNELNTKPLELTPGHMLYLASSELPVPAHSIKVGDVLKTAEGPSQVALIRKISRKGLANPLTLSGTIVVDGVVSSIHSEESGFKGSYPGWIYLSGIKISHWHSLVHFLHAPHRIVCERFMTCTEELTEDGLVPFDQYLVNLHVAAEKKQSVALSVLILLLLVAQTALFSMLELLIQHADVIKFVVAVACFVVGKGIVSKSFSKKTYAKVFCRYDEVTAVSSS